MVDRPWARQLWAMKPAFSSARQIASSPSFQFQLGMFSRWALITRYRERRLQDKENYTKDLYFLKKEFDFLGNTRSLSGRELALDEKIDSSLMCVQ